MICMKLINIKNILIIKFLVSLLAYCIDHLPQLSTNQLILSIQNELDFCAILPNEGGG